MCLWSSGLVMLWQKCVLNYVISWWIFVWLVVVLLIIVVLLMVFLKNLQIVIELINGVILCVLLIIIGVCLVGFMFMNLLCCFYGDLCISLQLIFFLFSSRWIFWENGYKGNWKSCYMFFVQVVGGGDVISDVFFVLLFWV